MTKPISTSVSSAPAASNRELPPYYNDLDGSSAHAWAMLVRGAADRRAAFHSPVVATADERGEPSQRVMVLRAVDVPRRTLRFHSDLRSAKLNHLKQQPRASVLAYDGHAKLQLRMGAVVSVHHSDEVAKAAWTATRPQGRLCYEQAVAPGQPIAAPLPELPAQARTATGDDGTANFAVLILTVDSLEWLYLATEGHRRAHWCWDGAAWQGQWLAP
jgi:pyridoxamine 5'-phosphate oxidase